MVHKVFKSIKDRLLRIVYSTAVNAQASTQTFGNIPDHIYKINPEIFSIKLQEQTMASAQRVINHTFYLLGKSMGASNKSILWNFDFTSSYHWPTKTFYRDINIPYGEADIKIPWELSRFQHLTVLGEAYQLTRDEKYATHIVAQIQDWIEKNPAGHGVNWTCAMDVAIRASNWILLYDLLHGSASLTDEFTGILAKNLIIHGRHIQLNLERAPGLTTNHYLADLAGLAYISAFLPEATEAHRWRTFTIRELKNEIKKQVYLDGGSFEASTCYHRLSLEIFFYCALVLSQKASISSGPSPAEKCQAILGAEYTAKLYKMFEAVLYLLKPNGRMPQIGDNDSGQFHKFSDREVLDMRYLLALGGIFFNESRFKLREFEPLEDAYWVFGPEGKKTWDSFTEHTISGIGSKAFPDSGWYIMRDKSSYVIISCGPNGQHGHGGHSHNDKLSFELHHNGKDILIDPGTYTYTADPDWRNQFRSTRFHNTVIIDDQEQNPINNADRGLFLLPDQTNARSILWDTTKDQDRFIGEHAGYQRLSPRVIHQREIIFHKTGQRKLIVVDRFQGTGEHTLTWNLNFAPGWTDYSIITSPTLSWRKEEGWYSSEYGQKQTTQRLTATIQTQLPCEHTFEVKLNP